MCTMQLFIELLSAPSYTRALCSIRMQKKFCGNTSLFSGSHKLAISIYNQMKEPTVNSTAQLSEHIQQNQLDNRSAMTGVIQAIQLLVRQGLALRGHDEKEGNLRELLRYTGKRCPQLASWLSRPKNVTKFLSPTSQNEIIELMYRAVLNGLLEQILGSLLYAMARAIVREKSKRVFVYDG